MKPVTKLEFDKIILPKTNSLRVVGNFPYTTEFKDRNGNIIGKQVDSIDMNPETERIKEEYFLC